MTVTTTIDLAAWEGAVNMCDQDDKAKIEPLTRESVIRGIAIMVLRSSRGRFTREEAEEVVGSAMPSFDTIVAAVNLQHGQVACLRADYLPPRVEAAGGTTGEVGCE